MATNDSFELGRMSNLKIILRNIGALQLIQSGLMFASIIVTLIFGEFYQAGIFFLSGLLTGTFGGILYWVFSDAPDPKVKHAMIIAGLGWFITAAFGSLPFFLTAYLTPTGVIESYLPTGATYSSSVYNFLNPLHALFEGMSGWTTTGLTMAVHEPSLPRGLLWWRTLMQWIGGMGVILLTVVVIRQATGMSGYLLFQSEARERKLRPSVLGTLRELWTLYLGVTIFAAIYLTVVLAIFEPDYTISRAIWGGVTHAMTAISTGGFSILDNSIATYQSYIIEVLYLPIMILGGIAYPVYYAVIREKDTSELLQSPQTRWLIILIVFGVPVLTLLSVLQYSTSIAFRQSLFQYISGITTTGFQSAPIGDWPAAAIVFIVAGAMVIGGSAGGTVGGIKIIRAYIIGKGFTWKIQNVFFTEHEIPELNLGRERLSREEMNRETTEATLLVLFYIVTLIISLIVLTSVVGDKYTLADTLFEVASAQSTVGLSSGITDPTMPVAAEIVLIFQMWIGRLEIIPVLVFFRALFLGFSR
ncbi:TrkH family potassium uptake protein [Haladaptatus halobius]|uniref:TrkH family potassium uptake protein n=1 Tax=Haladaptatus halobius TaxID=2884875 RepID=UPI001D0AFA3F|nr:TrkH family potassium uptake protein [Haladaptatus halobius]